MKDDLLARLQAARSVEERTLIVTRDLLESVSPLLRAASWAAAIPHWFDSDVLSALLKVSLEEAEALYADLQGLPFVEPFPDRGHNVHELTRGAMLTDWWTTRRDEYRTLSAHVAEFFSRREEPEWQVERAYHLLIADEDKGADALWNLGADWNNTFRYELVYALAQAAVEHVEAGRLVGRGGGWALFWHGQAAARFYHNTEAKAAFERALGFASGDGQLQANAITSLGDVHYSLDEYGAARERYEEALPIYREIGARLGEANAITSLGDVARLQKDFGTAEAHYQTALGIYVDIGARLGEANVLDSLGELAEAQERWPAAASWFQRALEIYEAIGSSYARVTQGNLERVQSKL
jgi:tetratricopeptide (TPR) repeat protein